MALEAYEQASIVLDRVRRGYMLDDFQIIFTRRSLLHF